MKKFNFLLLVVSLFVFEARSQTSSADLLLHMPFDGNVQDVSGNNNHGLNYGTSFAPDRFGVPDRACNFDGISSFIEVASSASLDRIKTTQAVTISAWVNIRQWYNGFSVFPIFGRYDMNNNQGWTFESNSATGGMLFLIGTGAPSDWASGAYLWQFNEWRHVAFTYDKAIGIASFYIDGQMVSSVPYTNSFDPCDQGMPYQVGASLIGPQEYSDGLMDDFKLYSKALSDKEIENIYNGETAGIVFSKSNKQAGLKANPTITSSTLTIDYPGKAAAAFQIINSFGNTVQNGVITSRSTTVDLSLLNPGIYIVHVEGFQPVKTIKK